MPLSPAEGALPLFPPAASPPSCRAGCERAAGESDNDRCARVRVRVRARVRVHLRGHLEPTRCWLRERGGKGNSASLDRFMRGRSVGVRKPRETGSRGGARARAGRLGVGGWGGEPWQGIRHRRRRPCPWRSLAPSASAGGASATLSLPLSVVLVPPSCKGGERVCVA